MPCGSCCAPRYVGESTSARVLVGVEQLGPRDRPPGGPRRARPARRPGAARWPRRARRSARSRSRCRSGATVVLDAPRGSPRRAGRGRPARRASGRCRCRSRGSARRRAKPPLRPDACQPQRARLEQHHVEVGVALAWPATRSTGRCSRRPTTTRSARGVLGQRRQRGRAGPGRRARGPPARPRSSAGCSASGQRARCGGGCCSSPSSTMVIAIRNITVPITLTCIGTPRCADAPDVHRERRRGAGVEVGDDEVVEGQREAQQRRAQDAREDQREGHPPERLARRWRRGPSPPARGCRPCPASRALTVTTTKDRQNMMCATRIVQKPSWPPKPAATNSASSEEPITISGEAIGRKISRLVDDAAREVVADQRERHQGAEDGRAEGGQQPDLDAAARPRRTCPGRRRG